MKVTAFIAWVALISLYSLWEVSQYRGLQAILAEWQFDNLGRYYPTLTYALVVFVLSLPGYLLFLRPRRSSAGEPEAQAMRSAQLFSRALAGGAVGLAVAALGAIIGMLWLPSSAGEVRQVTVASRSGAVPVEGPTRLSGSIAYDRVSAFDQELIMVRRNNRFAPVFPAGEQLTTIRYFVQLPPVDSPAGDRIATVTGVLRQNALPGEIVRLYRYAGFELERPYFVLFMDPAAMRWPYLSAAVQLLIASALAGVLALLQRRRLRRLGAAKDEAAI